MEVFDAGVGGRKGLLYVGCGGRADKDGRTVRFECGGAGEPLSFAADAILSCEAKGRYRIVVIYADAEGGRRMAVIRAQGTAVDRVMGAVEALATAASGGASGAAGGMGDGGIARGRLQGHVMDVVREAVVAAEISGGGGGASGGPPPAALGGAAGAAGDSVEAKAEAEADGAADGGGGGGAPAAADDMANCGKGGKGGAADALSNHATENS